MWNCLGEGLLLVSALSTDAFVSGLSYGTAGIHMPAKSLCVIHFICTGTLGLALYLGAYLEHFLPSDFAQWLSALVLFCLGTIKLFDSGIKAFLRRHANFTHKVQFSLFRFRCILQIYADPAQADCDHSKSLSLREASFLAVALSLDSLAVGIGAGLTAEHKPFLLLLALSVNALSIFGAYRLGQRMHEKKIWDISALGGVLLLLLAFGKL